MEHEDLVVSTLQGAGGSMTYESLFNATPYESRAHLPRAKKNLKRLGKLKEKVSVENGVVIHTVSLVTGE